MEVSESIFGVMGSTAHVLVRNAGAETLSWVEARLRQLEEWWTRFSTASEVSRINASSGEWTPVSHETVALVELSRVGWLMTKGLFDPTGLPALLTAGYVSSRLDPSRYTSGVAASSEHSPGCEGFETDEGLVRVPSGVTVDPGGIGKGLAADIVASELIRKGASGALVNIGGDLRVVEATANGGWTVTVEDPFQEGRTVARLNLAEGGVATTTPRHRRWRSENGNNVHLIDPRHGRPTDTDVESVTVIAGEAWIAEVVAKAAAICGCDAAPDLIDDFGLAGIVISNSGRVMLSSRVVEFLS